MTTKEIREYEAQRMAAHRLTWRELKEVLIGAEEAGFDMDNRAFVDIDGNTQGYIIELAHDYYECSAINKPDYTELDILFLDCVPTHPVTQECTDSATILKGHFKD